MDDEVQRAWEEFLNPDILRGRLISASIYIAGFESLKDTVEERPRDFYCNGFDEKGDRIDPYKTNVLHRNRSPVHASLDWLKEMGAIEESDVEAFVRMKNCRNALAHDLLSAVGSKGMPADFVECFQGMVALLTKIEVWWVKNVEIPINPDFDEEEIDMDKIMPGRVMALRLLFDIALGDEKTSRYYYDEFRKRAEEDGRD